MVVRPLRPALQGLIVESSTKRQLEAISLDWEKQTGYDSIAMIERLYGRASGAYVCVWPGCTFARRDSIKMWQHVHTAHGENSLPPEAYQI